MERLEKQTLVRLTQQLASHGWTEAELAELVDPKLGIITGLQALLDELDILCRTDNGLLAPAQGVQRPKPAK